MSHLRTGQSVGSGISYTFVGAEPYSARLPERYNGSFEEGFPKWYPNRAGERTATHLQGSLPAERYVSIDMYRRPPTSRSGQIIFDSGRANDGYYLPRNGCKNLIQFLRKKNKLSIGRFVLDDTTWFHSDIELNRRHILESIQPRTLAEYEQEKLKRQEQYRQANDKWPFLSEYAEQFVLGSNAEHTQPTEYVLKRSRKKNSIDHTRIRTWNPPLRRRVP